MLKWYYIHFNKTMSPYRQLDVRQSRVTKQPGYQLICNIYTLYTSTCPPPLHPFPRFESTFSYQLYDANFDNSHLLLNTN